jgi:putative PIN family toxin of toxin-antitoxin system
MIYVVFDTNVIVSALMTHNTTAATLLVLNKLFEGVITPVYNDEIMNEYDEVLHRAKFNFSDSDIRTVLEFIKVCGVKSDRLSYGGSMPDEKDRPFYEVSLSCEDSFLVTGNLKHFPAIPRVVSPAELIEIIGR